MNKSKTPLKQEPLQSADEVSLGLSRLSSWPEDVSASPPSSEPQPLPPPTETQRIGSLVMPKWAWSALWTHNANAVRMRLGGEIVEIQAKGHWEPPMPILAKRELPTPKSGESHQGYYLRTLSLFNGKPHPQELSLWHTTRKWEGEHSDALRDKIAAGDDLPGYSWAFVTEKTL